MDNSKFFSSVKSYQDVLRNAINKYRIKFVLNTYLRWKGKGETEEEK